MLTYLDECISLVPSNERRCWSRHISFHPNRPHDARFRHPKIALARYNGEVRKPNQHENNWEAWDNWDKGCASHSIQIDLMMPGSNTATLYWPSTMKRVRNQTNMRINEEEWESLAQSWNLEQQANRIEWNKPRGERGSRIWQWRKRMWLRWEMREFVYVCVCGRERARFSEQCLCVGFVRGKVARQRVFCAESRWRVLGKKEFENYGQPRGLVIMNTGEIIS